MIIKIKKRGNKNEQHGKMYSKMRDVIKFCVKSKSEISTDDEETKK